MERTIQRSILPCCDWLHFYNVILFLRYIYYIPKNVNKQTILHIFIFQTNMLCNDGVFILIISYPENILKAAGIIKLGVGLS